MSGGHPMKSYARRLQEALGRTVPYTTCLNHVVDTMPMLPVGISADEKDARILEAARIVFARRRFA